MSFDDFIKFLTEIWWQTLAGLLTSWLLLRQKYIRDEHNTMKTDIAKLQKDHAVINSTLENVKTNQKLMRETQNEIRTDIKQLIRMSSVKKGWFK